jgi:chemotaxis signal transduction protein
VTNHPERNHETAGLSGFVCCVVGEEQYAIRGADVRNVARAEQMREQAGAGARVGSIRHAGEQVPVYSLAALLGRGHDRAAFDRHIVVTRGASGSIGLLVDRVVRTPADERAAVLPLPSVVGDRALRRFEGLLRHNDLSYLVLSPVSLDPDAPAGRPLARPRPHSRAAAPMGGADMVAIFSSPSLPRCPADRYAIEAQRVEALVQALPSIRIPGAAPHVVALGWWRDGTVPVLSFHNNGADPSSVRQRFIVVRCGSDARSTYVAFAVTGDVALHRATREDALVPSDRKDTDFVRGVFGTGDEDVALLDIDILLTRTRDSRPAAVSEAVPVLM